MAFILDKIVPWGRSFDEYVAMFALSKDDLKKHILGCSDGPANFNSILTKQGGQVISVDPLYHFSADEIRKRIYETYEEVIEQTRQNKNEFVWHHISSIEELGRVRMEAMQEFLSDYPTGRMEGRYVEASLPSLPFKDRAFDISLNPKNISTIFSQDADVRYKIKIKTWMPPKPIFYLCCFV